MCNHGSSIGATNSVNSRIDYKIKIKQDYSFLAIVSLRFLAVGFSTVYGIVICYPLIASIQCITRLNF